MTHALAPEAQLEVTGWNHHRVTHRGYDYPEKKPKRSTPAGQSIEKFSKAIAEADKHRGLLKRRFGFNDSQIGTMAYAALKRRRQAKA